MNCIEISEINRRIKESPKSFADESEAVYHAQLHEAAEKIAADKDSCPVVLISGPSGSGKTTTALRIGNILQSEGIPAHIISMDNYFLPGETTDLPTNEDGSIDLESPYRLDIPLLNKHINMINNCETVEIPVFDFATQSRPRAVMMKRSKNEIVIFEGIHALNPEVTGQVSSFAKGIYVSVRTRIMSADGAVMHPRLIRLLRRINRDRLFRGRSIGEIFTLFDSVSKGEELYIMPFKDRASVEIDTFLAYEASVYKNAVYDDLLKCSSLADNEDYRTICAFLKELEAMDVKYSPKISLIREFVGGSDYDY